MLRRPAVLAAALVVAACSGSDPTADPSAVTPQTPRAEPGAPSADAATSSTSTPAAEPTTPTAIEYSPAAFVTTPGTEQITVTGAEPGVMLQFVSDSGDVIAEGVVDDNGALLQRQLPGGASLVVRDKSSATESEAVVVLTRTDHPDASFYAEQRLPTDGLGYVTTRDGTTLSASVWLPGPPENGPYPTVVEYSGYSPSDPESTGFSDILTGLGYAYVGVNMRGTGCSGGSFRYFEYSQSLDGYDAIEAVAAQPWVLDNRVGMVGVSYPGISQLFVAQTQPPSLAAITPFSVIADSFNSTLYPGGVLNTGFAVEWTKQRVEEARPEGQEWAAARIAAGDDTCLANQLLRLQNPDLTAEIAATPFWTDTLGNELAPRSFVDRIAVPTFVAGAWQDEQTGGHFATMLDRFTGTEHFYATLVNGLHTESIGPSVFPRFVEFLDLYVARRVPSLAAARAIAPQLSEAVYGTADVALPDTDRFAGMSYEDALAAFEAEPPIEVLFEEGAADGFPARAPMARWVESFDAWPIPGAVTTAWGLGADGTLITPGSGAAAAGEVEYLALPDAVPQAFYEGSSNGIWSVDVAYEWIEGGPGSFASFTTARMTDDTVVIGSGSVDLWVESNLGDTDLEVTITEIRPDGQEMYVQSGWLRASHRALDESASSELRPVHTHLESDASPLPDGEPTAVRVELFPFAHAFRAGSRIRLTVDAPGGNRGVWEFDTIANGEQVTISTGDVTPSRLVLPVVADVDVPPAYPECGALRGQPCRPSAG